MQSKFLKIALAWIGAFFCAWLFGNHMLDVSFVTPGMFFIIAIVCSVIVLNDKSKNKTIFNNVAFMSLIIWAFTCVILYFIKVTTEPVLILPIMFFSFVYIPFTLLAHKETANYNYNRANIIYKILFGVTLFAYMPAIYYTLFAADKDYGLQRIPLGDRFHQGVLVTIIFYFLLKYIGYKREHGNEEYGLLAYGSFLLCAFVVAGIVKGIWVA